MAEVKRSLQVLGRRMAYTEAGQGPPVLFLHGNPTSSYLWRDVIPPVAARARCLALDLIGMGDSEKLPPGEYGFETHSRFVDGFIAEELGTEAKLVLVVHDWGSALGFDWARRHPDRVRGIAYMEAIVRPLAGWEEWNPEAVRIFQGFRSAKGEEMILDRNLFVERVLPGSVIRPLTEADMTEYRRPSSVGTTAPPRSPGRARSRSPASRPMSWPACKPTPTGCRPARSPSCSSTPIRVPS